MPSLTQHSPLGPPPTFDDDACKGPDTIKAALQSHACENGYSIKADSSTAVKASWICSKGGLYDDRFKRDDVPEKKRRKNTSTMKTGCKFRVSAARQLGMP
jgi:hypothetical protein